jgi:hypothetical protein
VSFLTCVIGRWIPPFIKLILVVLSLIWSSKCINFALYSGNWIYRIDGSLEKEKVGSLPSEFILLVFELVCADCLSLDKWQSLTQ